MAEVLIHGASDDLVEISGIEGADEFNCNGNWTGLLTAPNGDTAFVYVDYRSNGTWTTAFGLWDEDYKLPQWPIEVTTGDDFNFYTTLTKITVPDGTTIQEWMK